MNLRQLYILETGRKLASKKITPSEFVNEIDRLTTKDVTFGLTDGPQPLYITIEAKSYNIPEVTWYSFKLKDVLRDAYLFSVRINKENGTFKMMYMPTTTNERIFDIIDTTGMVLEKFFKQEIKRKKLNEDEEASHEEEAKDHDDDHDDFAGVEVLQDEWGWPAPVDF
jgi:hypothetical protein